MLHRIMLHLARNPQFPAGSERHGYEIVAPLGKDGRLDRAAWGQHRDECRVRRFWEGFPDRRGRLTRKRGGMGGAQWAIDYDKRSTKDDEVGFRLDRHKFAPGEFVTISDQAGPHVFRVTSVDPLAGGIEAAPRKRA